jgi:hypothetical protein
MTYTWENIEAEIDVVEGICRKKQTTKKRILDHGRKLQVSKNSFYKMLHKPSHFKSRELFSRASF